MSLETSSVDEYVVLSDESSSSEEDAPPRGRRAPAGVRTRSAAPVPASAAGATGPRRSARRAAAACPEGECRAAARDALARLTRAKAAGAKQQAARQVRKRRRQVASEASSSSEEEPPRQGQAEEEQQEEEEEAPLPPAGRRQPARGGRRRAQLRFLTGACDYVSSSDGDLGDFIVDEGEDEGEESDDAGQEASGASQGGAEAQRRPARQRPSRRRHAAAAWSDDDEDAGAAGKAEGGPEEEGSGGEAVVPQPARRAAHKRKANVLESSESEDEVPAGPLAAAPAERPAAPNLRRPRKHGAAVAAAGSPEQQQPQQQASKAASAQKASGKHAVAEAVAEEVKGVSPLAAGVMARRRRQREQQERERATALSAAARIRQAQQEWQEDEEAAPAEPLASDAEASVLTDEGDPGTTESEQEGEEEEGEQQQQQQQQCARRKHGSTPRGNEGWQRAAEVLGLGSYSERELFCIYCEYMLLCYVDPGYAAEVAASPRHLQYYQQATSRIEFEMNRARGTVASDAWKRSAGGLLQALERLPGLETGWASEEQAQELAGQPCDACNRSRSHATRQLVLKGRPYTAAWGDGALILNRRLSDQRLSLGDDAEEDEEEAEEGRQLRGYTSPARPSGARGTQVARRQRGAAPHAPRQGNEHGEQEAGERGDKGQEQRPAYERRRFYVGRFCCARLVLYHGIFHWRRRLLSRLKQELKRELRRCKRARLPLNRSDVADAVLRKESLLAELYANCKTLRELADRYQLSGGEGSRGGWKAEFDGMHAEVAAALRDLHSDSEGEEASVVWPGKRGEEGDASAEDGEGGGESSSGGNQQQQQPPPQQQQGQSQPEVAATPDTGGSSGRDALPSSQRVLRSPTGLRQVDIRSFFSRCS
eukprot:scaffold7.g3624.t1